MVLWVFHSTKIMSTLWGEPLYFLNTPLNTTLLRLLEIALIPDANVHISLSVSSDTNGVLQCFFNNRSIFLTAFYYLLAARSTRTTPVFTQKVFHYSSIPCWNRVLSYWFSSFNYPFVVRFFTLNMRTTSRPEQTYPSQCYYHFIWTILELRTQLMWVKCLRTKELRALSWRQSSVACTNPWMQASDCARKLFNSCLNSRHSCLYMQSLHKIKS